MNLAIDIGNSRTKVAVFDGDTLVEVRALSRGDEPRVISALFALYPITHTVISNVIDDDGFNLPIPAQTKVLLLNSSTPVPLINLYRSPNTLGVDRLALAVAAVKAYPGESILVIDAGTCITYDLVSSLGEYIGGAISPGLQMRLDAMHQFTGKLPQLSFEEVTMTFGVDTASCMRVGAGNGFMDEIRGFVNRYQYSIPDLKTIITGGNMDFIEHHAEIPIFAAPNFLLYGMNQILLYNVGR